MDTLTLTAPDISCDHCKHAIETSVGELDGVKTCAVDVSTKRVQVTYDSTVVDRARIVQTLVEEGYPVSA